MTTDCRLEQQQKIRSCNSRSLQKQLKELLKHTSAIDVHDTCGRTALYFASFYMQAALVEALLRAGADPNVAEKRKAMTPMLIACEGGKLSIVREMLKYASFLLLLLTRANRKKENARDAKLL